MDAQQERHGEDPPTGLPKNLLECGVCLALVCEPVSLSCGHTFCRICLVKTLQRAAKRCPCCRAVCHTSAEDQPQNVMIAQIVKALFPKQLERRMRETEVDKAKFELCLPAFLYNVPVIPGETMCLNFFEPRYKLMMKRIINTSRRFAYIPNYTNYAAKQGDTALVAEVVDAEFYSDGRALVKTKLTGRYAIQDCFVEEGTQGLYYCQLEPFEDDAVQGADVDELQELHAQARALCHGFLGPFKNQLVQSHGDVPPGAVALSMWMASFLLFDAAEKQRLLVTRCTRERLRACLRCAASMEKMQKVIKGTLRSSAAAERSSPPPPPPPALMPASRAGTRVSSASASGGGATAAGARMVARSGAAQGIGAVGASSAAAASVSGRSAETRVPWTFGVQEARR